MNIPVNHIKNLRVDLFLHPLLLLFQLLLLRLKLIDIDAFEVIRRTLFAKVPF